MNRIFVYGAIGLVIGEIVGSPIVHHEYDHSHQECLADALPNSKFTMYATTGTMRSVNYFGNLPSGV
jgi:hypothetical protein